MHIFRFSQAGAGKGKSAMESARARYAAVMQLGKDEDEAAKKLPDWSPPIQSRPGTTTDIDNMVGFLTLRCKYFVYH